MPTIRYARKPLPTSPWHVDTRKTDFDASFDRLENHPLTFLPRDHLPTRTDNFWSFCNTDDADGLVCKVIDKKGELGDPLDFEMNGEDLAFTIYSLRCSGAWDTREKSSFSGLTAKTLILALPHRMGHLPFQ
uniref:Uncharacterized protein n=1 Tax=Vespula pensylvanica TaxID=30213 RepID=A0A834P9K7_VESPE|nr:hypothetical protein H0235_002128 [Vespula pensylvanica]